MTHRENNRRRRDGSWTILLLSRPKRSLAKSSILFTVVIFLLFFFLPTYSQILICCGIISSSAAAIAVAAASPPTPSRSLASDPSLANTRENKEDTDHDSNRVKKRLVLFAGPLATGGPSVEKFFYDYALGDLSSTQDEKSFPLRYWKWPRIDNTATSSGQSSSSAAAVIEEIERDGEIKKEPYKVFKLLVTEAGHGPIQEAILGAIEEAWETAAAGIIVGTEQFGMGSNGLAAMQRIVKRLQIRSPSDVTVVINYRTPRFAQWQSVWSQSVHEDSDLNDATSYQDWLCDKDSSSDKIRLLQSQMNPLKMVQSIIQQFKWQVALMDMKGIDNAGLDVSHIIACQIMHVKCTDDNTWVKKHDHEGTGGLMYGDVASDGMAGSPTGLTEQDQELAEDLFRFRDCGLKSQFVDSMKHIDDTTSVVTSASSGHSIFSPDDFKPIGLTIFHKSELWDACYPEMEHIYDKLENPELIYKSLLSQTECGRSMVGSLTIRDTLTGTSGDKAASDHGETWKQVVIEAVLYPLFLISALMYQICRMYRGNLVQRRYQKIAVADDDGEVMEAEMTQFRPSLNIGLNAEYGEASDEEDIDDGNNNEQKERGKRHDDDNDDDDDDEFLDALESQSSLEIGDAK